MAARVRPVCTAALAAALLAACSGGAPARDRAATPPAATAGAEPSSARPAPAPQVPLALVVHPARPALDVRAGLARAALAGSVTDWRQLGGRPGALTLVAAAGTTAGGVLSAAEVVAAVGRDGRVLGAVPADAVGPSVRVLTVDGVHPLRRPAEYPLRTAGAVAPPARVVTASVAGDIMLGRRVGRRLAAGGDFAAALRPTAARLASADVTIGNLESTLARRGAPRQGGDSFAADPRVRRGLQAAGFDVLSLANNHTGDFGPASLVETVRLVRRAGIEPVGAGVDLAEAAAPAVVERGGLTFGVVAFDAIGETPAATAARPGALRVRMLPRTGPLVRRDLDRVVRIVRELRPRVDVLLVLPHWGTQYTTRTVADQRTVGRALVDAGADLVVGGHPHWVQGMELRRGRPIVYSLGNFVFDMDFSRRTREGAILELVFWGPELKAAELVPVRIGADFAPRVAAGRAGQAILDQVWGASGPPLTGSHRPRS